jgi:hypothetical protein
MGGRGGRERAGKMNMMQKSVHMYGNAKMIPVETGPGTGGGQGYRRTVERGT